MSDVNQQVQLDLFNIDDFTPTNNFHNEDPQWFDFEPCTFCGELTDNIYGDLHICDTGLCAEDMLVEYDYSCSEDCDTSEPNHIRETVLAEAQEHYRLTTHHVKLHRFVIRNNEGVILDDSRPIT